MLCFYLSGWASETELITHLERLHQKAPPPCKNWAEHYCPVTRQRRRSGSMIPAGEARSVQVWCRSHVFGPARACYAASSSRQCRDTLRPPQRRDLLRPVFLTRSGGVQMEAG